MLVKLTPVAALFIAVQVCDKKAAAGVICLLQILFRICLIICGFNLTVDVLMNEYDHRRRSSFKIKNCNKRRSTKKNFGPKYLFSTEDQPF